MSRRASVLTVEDDPIVRADLRLILEDAGYDVVPDARDGIEAVTHARVHRPDVILLDLGLPRIDGVEAARRIRNESRVPIVALTGRGNDEAHRRIMDAGAASVVMKPFHHLELVRSLEEALEPARRQTAEESADFRRRALIERMVQRNAGEREITRALRGV